MSEITTMLMAEHRQVALDAQHPMRAMAYDVALARKLARRGRWRALSRLRLGAAPAVALDGGC